MPRKARIDAPGALHHVIVRGIERRKIFRVDDDRENLLNRLSLLIPETKTDCFAWALMPNHFHLLLRTGSIPIARLMQRLLTGYAGWFNRKYRRHGKLFQNRYKSILCQEDSYLKELVRYIHLNPLRSGAVGDVEELGNYSWSGHSTIMNNTTRSWQNTKHTLGLFADRKKLAVNRYRAFVEKGISHGRRDDLTGGGLLRSLGGWTALKELRTTGARIKSDERILGDNDFVSDVLHAADEALEEKYDLAAKGYDFDQIVDRVSQVLDIKTDQVTAYGKAPKTVQARSLLCFWAHRRLGLTTVEVSKKLGVCQPTVSRLSKKGEALANEQGFKLL